MNINFFGVANIQRGFTYNAVNAAINASTNGTSAPGRQSGLLTELMNFDKKVASGQQITEADIEALKFKGDSGNLKVVKGADGLFQIKYGLGQNGNIADYSLYFNEELAFIKNWLSINQAANIPNLEILKQIQQANEKISEWQYTQQPDSILHYLEILDAQLSTFLQIAAFDGEKALELEQQKTQIALAQNVKSIQTEKQILSQTQAQIQAQEKSLDLQSKKEQLTTQQRIAQLKKQQEITQVNLAELEQQRAQQEKYLLTFDQDVLKEIYLARSERQDLPRYDLTVSMEELLSQYEQQEVLLKELAFVSNKESISSEGNPIEEELTSNQELKTKEESISSEGNQIKEELSSNQENPSEEQIVSNQANQNKEELSSNQVNQAIKTKEESISSEGNPIREGISSNQENPSEEQIVSNQANQIKEELSSNQENPSEEQIVSNLANQIKEELSSNQENPSEEQIASNQANQNKEELSSNHANQNKEEVSSNQELKTKEESISSEVNPFKEEVSSNQELKSKEETISSEGNQIKEELSSNQENPSEEQIVSNQEKISAIERIATQLKEDVGELLTVDIPTLAIENEKLKALEKELALPLADQQTDAELASEQWRSYMIYLEQRDSMEQFKERIALLNIEIKDAELAMLENPSEEIGSQLLEKVQTQQAAITALRNLHAQVLAGENQAQFESLFALGYLPPYELISTASANPSTSYSSNKTSKILIAASLILVPGPKTATAPASNKNW